MHDNEQRTPCPPGRAFFLACQDGRKSLSLNDLKEHYARIKSLLTIS